VKLKPHTAYFCVPVPFSNRAVTKKLKWWKVWK